MRVFFILLVTFFLSQNAKGQIKGYFGEINGSFLQNSENGRQSEFALRNSVGLLLGRYFAAGMKVQHILYNNIASGTEYMHIWGPFGRAGIFREQLRFYGEVGFNWGDYRSLSGMFLGAPTQESGLLYISWGWSAELRMREGIFCQLGLITHDIINRSQPSTGFSSYLIGLSFDLQAFGR